MPFFGILIGILGKLSEKDLVNTFVDGARDMLGVALIIGVARGITVIMNNGLITDTGLYWAESAVQGLGGVGFILVTYLLYIPLSFLIPSTSGLATVSMPIMAPLSSFAGVPAYLVVTAYQAASGFGKPGYPDLCSGHGSSGNRQSGIRHMVEVRVAGSLAACCAVRDGTGRRRGCRSMSHLDGLSGSPAWWVHSPLLKSSIFRPGNWKKLSAGLAHK